MLPIFYACGYRVITVGTIHVGMDDRVLYTSAYLMSRGFGVCVFLLSAKARHPSGARSIEVHDFKYSTRTNII